VARRLVEPLGRPVHISAITPVAETGTRTSCTEDQSWLIAQSRTDEVTDDEFDLHEAIGRQHGPTDVPTPTGV
jgi:hypothetical protein